MYILNEISLNNFQRFLCSPTYLFYYVKHMTFESQYALKSFVISIIISFKVKPT